SAMLSGALTDCRGQRPREPIGFTGPLWPPAAAAAVPKMGQILQNWRFFGLLCLDSGLFPAIKPAIRRGISCAACFCAESNGVTRSARNTYPYRLNKKPTRAHA